MPPGRRRSRRRRHDHPAAIQALAASAAERHRREPPRYTKYRSRPKLFGRGSDAVEVTPEGVPRDAPAAAAGGAGTAALGAWRVVRWVAARARRLGRARPVLFLVSAQIEQGKVSDAADAQLGGAGFPLTSPNTILVLGSDQRGSATARAGRSTSAPGRSDSIMLHARRRRGERAAVHRPRHASSTSPATAGRRSTRPTPSAARRSRSDGRAVHGHRRSTTSSRSTSTSSRASSTPWAASTTRAAASSPRSTAATRTAA